MILTKVHLNTAGIVLYKIDCDVEEIYYQGSRKRQRREEPLFYEPDTRDVYIHGSMKRRRREQPAYEREIVNGQFQDEKQETRHVYWNNSLGSSCRSSFESLNTLNELPSDDLRFKLNSAYNYRSKEINNLRVFVRNEHQRREQPAYEWDNREIVNGQFQDEKQDTRHVYWNNSFGSSFRSSCETLNTLKVLPSDDLRFKLDSV